MFKRDRKDSIISRIDATGLYFSAVLVAFVVINLVLMLLFEQRYDSFINSIDTIVSLKTVVYEEVPEEVWETIAGRRALEDCRAADQLDEVSAKIAQLQASAALGEETQLMALQRALGTMYGYVIRIEENIRSSVNVDDSQALLTDLREVGSLARDMLESYIAQRIRAEAEQNVLSRGVFAFVILLEVLVWGGAICYSRLMNMRLSAFITGQIKTLEDFAGRLAEGHLDSRAPGLQTEELRPLTASLNTMAIRLSHLMGQHRREQENLKKAELRLLQAQINPHFLYNTLDAIIWQAEAGHSAEVIHITRALSDFFRISLSAGKEWITIAQERRHLEGYLSIQRVRYRDILSYVIDIEPDIEDAVILKLLLQPLVENALYHGIKNKRGGGVIRVVGRREGDLIRFEVRDTGMGMTPQRLEEVRKATTSNDMQITSPLSHGSGFGLKNVDMRIRLYYGCEKGLSIDSDAGGTTVSFSVPYDFKPPSVI